MPLRQQENQAGHLAQQTWLPSLGGFIPCPQGGQDSGLKEEVQCLVTLEVGKGTTRTLEHCL